MLRSIRRRKDRIPPPPKPGPAPLVIPKPANVLVPSKVKYDTTAGVTYVAYGAKAKEAVQESIKSLHVIHPGLPVAVISNSPTPGADEEIIEPEKDIGAREYKTQVWKYSPFSLTCYLDADTVVVGSLQAGFDALIAGWDVAMAFDYRQSVGQIDHIPANDVKTTLDMIGTGEYPHFNAGVIFFSKSPEAEELYNLWHEEWLKFKYRDQAAFIRALHQSRARLWVLSWQWNTHRKDRALHVWHNHHAVDRTWGKRTE